MPDEPTRSLAGHGDPTAGAAPGSDRTARERAGDTIGPYRLLEPIGEGGFGEVWLAERREPIVLRVALKILKAGMDSRDVLARFEQERQALAVMSHPNVANVLDAGTSSRGLPYFVMEHVPGEPITAYCDRHKLTVRERLALFIPVCEAVQHAHHKGIIHRDLKPSNILVAMLGDRVVPKVIDFGVAKAVSHTLTEKTIFTEQGRLIGTPEYMSPEQADMGATDIDTRTDVYSLGVVLYELLAGVLPFDRRTLRSKGFAEIHRIIREVDAPKPSTKLSQMSAVGGEASEARAPGTATSDIASRRRTAITDLTRQLRRELDWIPLKAIRKDRAERYATPMGLAKDIQRYLAGEPLEAGPEAATYRLKKLIKRNRGAVTAAALIFAALCAGLGATLWQASEARRQAARADERARAAGKAEAESRAAGAAEKERADQLKEVADFQSSMLSGIDPTEAGGRLTKDVTARLTRALESEGVPEPERPRVIEGFRTQWDRVNATDAAVTFIDETILKPAVRAVDARFKDQPVVDARLRQVLAARYRDLGLLDAAAPLQETALATRRRVLGEDHPDTIASIHDMGGLLQEQGRFDRAEPYFREALEKFRRVLGEEHPETLTAIANLGMLLEDRGEFAEAEAYVREGLEKRRRVLGPEHPDTLNSMNFLGLLLRARGRLNEAGACFRELLEKRRRVLGENHPDTLVSINNVGLVLKAQGKLDEAEPYYRESLEKTRRALGEENPDTLDSVSNMGLLLLAQGKTEEAEPYYREALEKRRRVLGEDHPDTIISVINMGYLLKVQGKPEPSELFFREALEKAQRTLGPEHRNTLAATINLGLLLIDLGRFTEAEALLFPAVEIVETKYPDRHPVRVGVTRAVMKLYEARAKAEPGKGYDPKAAEWNAKLEALTRPEPPVVEGK